MGASIKNSGNHGVRVESGANGTVIKGVTIQRSANEDLLIQANDISLWNVAAGTISVEGSRPRFNGVIGGGPLGGIDLSSVSARPEDDGVQALSDGTVTDAPYGTLATWNDANSQGTCR